MLKRCLILLLLLVGFAGFLPAQNSSRYVLDKTTAINKYNSVLKRDFGFLVGKTYDLYHYGLETSPLFNATLGMEGTVFAGGDAYPATLMYDIYKDELVMLTEIFPDCNFISLNKEVIDSFKVVAKPDAKSPLKLSGDKEYVFVNVDFPDDTGVPLNDGFYEITKLGENAVFVQHQAIQGNNEGQEAIIQGIYRYDYVQNKTLFLNGKYYQLSSKRKFLKEFPGHKKDLAKKLRSYQKSFEDITALQVLETVQMIKN
jgi:hypothetical protein